MASGDGDTIHCGVSCQSAALPKSAPLIFGPSNPVRPRIMDDPPAPSSADRKLCHRAGWARHRPDFCLHRAKFKYLGELDTNCRETDIALGMPPVAMEARPAQGRSHLIVSDWALCPRNRSASKSRQVAAAVLPDVAKAAMSDQAQSALGCSLACRN